jgi:hypothetical protein
MNYKLQKSEYLSILQTTPIPHDKYRINKLETALSFYYARIDRGIVNTCTRQLAFFKQNDVRLTTMIANKTSTCMHIDAIKTHFSTMMGYNHVT